MTLGKKIQTLRKLNNLSQAQLASKVHVSRQTISKYEADLSIPDVEKIKDIATALKCSVEDLLSIKSIEEITDEERTLIKEISKMIEEASIKNKRSRKKNQLFMLFLAFCIILSLGMSINFTNNIPKESLVEVNQPSNDLNDIINSQLSTLSYFDLDVSAISLLTKDISIKIKTTPKSFEKDGALSIKFIYSNIPLEHTISCNYENNEFVAENRIPLGNISMIEVIYKKDDIIQSQLFKDLKLDLSKYVGYYLPDSKLKLNQEIKFKQIIDFDILNKIHLSSKLDYNPTVYFTYENYVKQADIHIYNDNIEIYAKSYILSPYENILTLDVNLDEQYHYNNLNLEIVITDNLNNVSVFSYPIEK